MKKNIKIITLFFTICFSQEALLDFSNYAYDEQIDRPIERLTGFNPYNPVEFTRKVGISELMTIFKEMWIYIRVLVCLHLG